ncbi:MAG TPA: Ig-like domain repeat protein [Tepidisphaeraceae bacterium]|nr:Ig-like domain repeat protein [Tepidisphaeraceae bacterium]
MSALIGSRRSRSARAQFQRFLSAKHANLCVCENVESRVLLSTSTFATPTSITVTGARAPLVGERFNGSSSPADIAVATATTVQILTGSGSGTFTLGASIPLPANPAAESPYSTGDYSGSGTEDIVLNSYNSSTGNGEITYETNDGSANFTAGPVTDITNGGDGFVPIVAKTGDFNGDGDEDLAIVGKPNTGSQLVLAVLLSNADGTFTEADYPIAGSNAAGDTSNEEVFTAISDEIIVYDGSSQNLDVFSTSGDGVFAQLTPTPLMATLLSVGTFNSDQDIIVANGSQVSLLVNQGDGTFQADPQGPITLPGAINAMDVDDFNNDGNNDIITNQGILFGNGDETFDTTAEALPVSIDGGGNVSNTLQGVFLGNGRPGIVGFAAAGNAVVAAVNTTPVGVSIDLESDNNPANPGSDVQLTASVSSDLSNFSATPSGSITFFNGAASLGTVQMSDGSATLDAGSSLDTGVNTVTAEYSGDATFAATTSAPLTQTGLTSTATTISSNENPSTAGDDVVFTAVVSGDDGAGDVPSGNVEFFDNGTDLGGGDCDSTGTATFDTTGTLTAGSHTITAQYQGDSNYTGSESDGLTQTVNQPSLVPLVTSTSLPSAIVAGSKVHGTVTVALTNETSDIVSVSQITVLASSNSSIEGASPVVVENFHHAVAIKPGQVKIERLVVKTFPSGLSDGTYSLLAQVTNSLDQQSNSMTGPSINVAAAFVSLSGSASVKPASVVAGKFVTLTIDLSNAGNVITTPAALDIGLSTDGQTESSDIESASAHLKIKPGHSGPVHVHFRIPAGTAAGTYEPFISITDDGDTATVIGQGFVVET